MRPLKALAKLAGVLLVGLVAATLLISVPLAAVAILAASTTLLLTTSPEKPER